MPAESSSNSQWHLDGHHQGGAGKIEAAAKRVILNLFRMRLIGREETGD
jgi:hypothetical protein